MTYSAQDYLVNILTQQKLADLEIAPMRQQRDQIERDLRRVFGSAPRFYYGGSFGKSTMIKASYDLDIVMYFPSTEQSTLRNIYNSVNQALLNSRYIVQPKTVALRLSYQAGYHIDVVPGRAQDNTFRYATLYKNGEDTTMQTSIKVHIETIGTSGAREIIKLIKLWRIRHGLKWETFALEQFVIRALSGRRKDDYSACVLAVFEYIRDNILTIRLIDPANTNNIIDIPTQTRNVVRQAAINSLNAQSWSQIIW